MLHPARAVYWREQSMLLVADLHLGKAGHFRKAGIPIPALVHRDDLSRLQKLVEYYAPAKVLILGDLFHSDHNLEWNQFISFVRGMPASSVGLVTGNHDILEMHRYEDLIKYEDTFVRPPFIFSHKTLQMPALSNHSRTSSVLSEPDQPPPAPDFRNSRTQLYNISGHVHPAIRVPVGLRHSIRAHCFYFDQNHAILPAFGLFTGTHMIKPDKKAQIYAIVEDQVVSVKT